MKAFLIWTAILVTGVSVLAQEQKKGPPPPQLTMTIPELKDGMPLPLKFSCNNTTRLAPTPEHWPSGVSPHILWKNTLPKTQSFALIYNTLEPRENKSIYNVMHWFIYNIPATATELPEGVAYGDLPDGAKQLKNVRKFAGYYGGCAPVGSEHHFVFQLFDLDTKLNLGPDATRADAEKAMDGHILGSAVYVQIGRVHLAEHR